MNLHIFLLVFHEWDMCVAIGMALKFPYICRCVELWCSRRQQRFYSGLQNVLIMSIVKKRMSAKCLYCYASIFTWFTKNV